MQAKILHSQKYIYDISKLAYRFYCHYNEISDILHIYHGLTSLLSCRHTLPDVMLSHTQLELRDKNDRLHAKLEQLQDRYGSIAHVKTDLSSQLLSNEEEKLKVTTTRNVVTVW